MDKTYFNNSIKIFKKHNIKPDCFIDLGCGTKLPHIKDCESWWFHHIYPDVKIIGLEPQPIRYKQHIDNNFPGVILNVGAHHTDCDINVVIENKHGQVNMTPNHSDRKMQKIIIKCRTLIDIYNEYGPFENIFLWADIEGAELNALKGGISLLKDKKIKVLNLELWPLNANKIWSNYVGNRCSANEVIDFLSQFGYHLVNKPKGLDLNDKKSFESIKWFSDYQFTCL